jgi:hypothetical protein
MYEICREQWRLLLGSAETAALSRFLWDNPRSWWVPGGRTVEFRRRDAEPAKMYAHQTVMDWR